MYTQTSAPAMPFDNIFPLPDGMTSVHKWPNQPFSVDAIFDNSFWDPSMTALNSTADSSFDASNVMQTDLSGFDVPYPYHNLQPDASTRVSSTGLDRSSVSESPSTRDSDCTGPSLSIEGNTPAQIDVRSDNDSSSLGYDNPVRLQSTNAAQTCLCLGAGRPRTFTFPGYPTETQSYRHQNGISGRRSTVESKRRRRMVTPGHGKLPRKTPETD